jgi:hypothetical protein
LDDSLVGGASGPTEEEREQLNAIPTEAQSDEVQRSWITMRQ